MRVIAKDISKITFNIHYNKYEFIIMSFEFINAFATFQTIINNIFKSYLNKFVIVYLNDILIFSNTLKEYIKYLKIILQKL